MASFFEPENPEIVFDRIIADDHLERELPGCVIHAHAKNRKDFQPGAVPEHKGMGFFVDLFEAIRLVTEQHPLGSWKLDKQNLQRVMVAPIERYGCKVCLACFTGEVDGLSVYSNNRGTATIAAARSNEIALQYELPISDDAERPKVRVLTTYVVTKSPKDHYDKTPGAMPDAYLVLPRSVEKLDRKDAIEQGKPTIIDCVRVHRLGSSGSDGGARILRPTGDTPTITPRKAQ